MLTSSKKRSYRRRVKSSECRGQTSSTCRYMKSHCNYTHGKKRRFCRKNKNTKRRH
jgi:hypothetical protein